MRVLTHNTLKSPAKDAAQGLPLALEIGELKVVESPLNVEFMRATLPSLDWSGLLVAARAVGLAEGTLPERYDPVVLADATLLQSLHTLLLDIHIESGALVCTETGRRFPIANGIPNMLIGEQDCA